MKFYSMASAFQKRVKSAGGRIRLIGRAFLPHCLRDIIVETHTQRSFVFFLFLWARRRRQRCFTFMTLNCVLEYIPTWLPIGPDGVLRASLRAKSASHRKIEREKERELRAPTKHIRPNIGSDKWPDHDISVFSLSISLSSSPLVSRQ